ncbi:MAG: hypothetical protein ACYTGS_03190, partial [Planctomycetota bacterium]
SPPNNDGGASPTLHAPNNEGLVLRYSFDKADAADSSGNSNNGTVVGATTVKGKLGRAMRFTGSAGSVPGFDVKHNWTKDVPLFARAMVLAGRTLFVAGPPDVVDEDQAFRQINDPGVAHGRLVSRWKEAGRV